MKTEKSGLGSFVLFGKNINLSWLFLFLILIAALLTEAAFLNFKKSKEMDKIRTDINNPSTPNTSSRRFEESYKPEVSYNLTGVIRRIDGRNLSLAVTSKDSKLEFKDVVIGPETRILKIELVPKVNSKIKETKKVALGVEALKEGSSVEIISSNNILDVDNKSVFEIKVLD